MQQNFIDSMQENLIQEIPSTYFNNIIRRDVAPISVDELEPAVVEQFYEIVEQAFTDEADAAKERVRYLIPYILQNIDWDIYPHPLEAWQLRYYYQRERFLKKTHLTWEDFMAHEPMQDAIARLGLAPAPVFEFILFLSYYYSLRSELRYSSMEQLGRLLSELKAAPEANISMDVKVNNKHFKIDDARFLNAMFDAIDIDMLKGSGFRDVFNQGASREKIRALDYYIVKTLLDYLPTDKTLRRGGRFSQAERNFGLSVLSLRGRLPDIDREGECSQENNATFDKLMRDFSGRPIPFAMELFL